MLATQFLVGALLVLLGALFWLASFNPGLQSGIERTFGLEAGSLFLRGKKHSNVVWFSRYLAFWVGVAIVIPTRIIVDVIILMVAGVVYFILSRKKLEHDKVLAETVAAQLPQPHGRHKAA